MSDAVIPAAGPGLKGETTIVEPDRHERAAGRRSAESRATVPTVEYTEIVDAAALPAGSAAASVVAATARALRAVPRVNAAYRDGRFELYSRVNVGVTLATDSAYTTPTIFDADTKSVGEIAAELAALRERTEETELHPSELAGATFTVTDASVAELVAPLIQPPQAGALSFGPIREVPVVRDGAIVPGRTLRLAFAADHRIVYGQAAAAFLAALRTGLEEESA